MLSEQSMALGLAWSGPSYCTGERKMMKGWQMLIEYSNGFSNGTDWREVVILFSGKLIISLPSLTFFSREPGGDTRVIGKVMNGSHICMSFVDWDWMAD